MKTVSKWCCTFCGGTEVLQDAFVHMNDPDDVRTFDDITCDDCGGACSVELREVVEENGAK